MSKPGSPRQEAAGDAAAGTPAGSSAGQASARQASARQASAGEASAGEASAGQASAGQPQQPGGGGTQGQAAASDLAVTLAERTADLQRVQAEYANYRKRVERDRIAVREHALASVVAELLPVLDDIGRAREHDELTGGFKAIAESLEAAAAKLGLTTFGEAGEAFDPNVHEALMHSYSPDVTEPTCVQILQPGYRVGERILRPARVAVAEPTDPAGARTASSSAATDEGQGREGTAETDDHAPDDAD